MKDNKKMANILKIKNNVNIIDSLKEQNIKNKNKEQVITKGDEQLDSRSSQVAVLKNDKEAELLHKSETKQVATNHNKTTESSKNGVELASTKNTQENQQIASNQVLESTSKVEKTIKNKKNNNNNVQKNKIKSPKNNQENIRKNKKGLQSTTKSNVNTKQVEVNNINIENIKNTKSVKKKEVKKTVQTSENKQPVNIFLNDAIFILKNNTIPEKLLSKFSKDESSEIKNEKKKLYSKALNEAIIILLNNNISDITKETYLINYAKHIVSDIEFALFEKTIFEFIFKYIETFKTKIEQKDFELIYHTIENELILSSIDPTNYKIILEQLYSENTILKKENNKNETPIPVSIITNVFKKNQLLDNFSLTKYSANQKTEFYKNIVLELIKVLDKSPQNFYNCLINFSDKLLPHIPSSDGLIICKYFVKKYHSKNSKDTVVFNLLTTIKNHYTKILNEKDVIIFNSELDKIAQPLQYIKYKPMNKVNNDIANDKKYLVQNKILGYNLGTTLILGSFITGSLFALFSY